MTQQVWGPHMAGVDLGSTATQGAPSQSPLVKVRSHPLSKWPHPSDCHSFCILRAQGPVMLGRDPRLTEAV